MKKPQVKNGFFGILIDLPAEVFFMWNLNLTFQMEPDSRNFRPGSDFRWSLGHCLDGETEAQSMEMTCPK